MEEIRYLLLLLATYIAAGAFAICGVSAIIRGFLVDFGISDKSVVPLMVGTVISLIAMIVLAVITRHYKDVNGL